MVDKYKRADFDSVEKNELESSLKKLQEEQEEYKKANGLDKEDSNSENESLEQFDGIGNSYLPTGSGLVSSNLQLPDMINEQSLQMSPMSSVSDMDLSSLSNTARTPRTPLERLPDAPQPKSGAIEPTYTPELEAQLATPNTAASVKGSGEFSPYSTSIAPSLISGAASGIGNLLLAGQQKDSLPRVNLQRVGAPNISYAQGRAASKREAARATGESKYASKRASRTRGEYLSNVGAKEAAISGRLGESLSKSHADEALVNAKMKAGMSRANAQIAAKEEMFNAQQSSKESANREAYLSAAIGTIPQMTKDITATKSQDKLMSILGEDYGWYNYKDPNAKWYKSKKPVVGYRGKKGVQLAKGYK